MNNTVIKTTKPIIMNEQNQIMIKVKLFMVKIETQHNQQQQLNQDLPKQTDRKKKFLQLKNIDNKYSLVKTKNSVKYLFKSLKDLKRKVNLHLHKKKNSGKFSLNKSSWNNNRIYNNPTYNH